MVTRSLFAALSTTTLLAHFSAAQAPCPGPATTCTRTLSNALASYTFEVDETGREAWLSQGALVAGNRVVPFHKTSMWEVVLRIDPEDSVNSMGAPAAPHFSESRLRTDAPEVDSFTFAVIPVNNHDYDNDGVVDPTFIFEWTGSFQDNDAGDGGGPAPLVKIDAFWTLNGIQDYLQAAVVVEIINPSQETRYKIWSCAFPRLDICNLDDDMETQWEDKLATGRWGGLLHGNPINYVDPYDPNGGGFVFQNAPGAPNSGLPALTAVEPGVHVVPLWCYYRSWTGGGAPQQGYGVYLANNDDQGMFKAVHLDSRPEVEACPLAQGPGALGFEIVQYPHSLTSSDTDIFEMTRYESPYGVFVGVFNGDWVDGAKKYRHYRLHNPDGRFEWLDEASRPSGKDTNPFIPDELKNNPYQLKLHGGKVSQPWDGSVPEVGGQLSPAGYCVDEIALNAALELEVSDRLAFFEQEFAPGVGPGFPLLIFDRFPVTAGEVTYDSFADQGVYVPSSDPKMQKVHALLQSAGVRHRILLDSMTEKFNIGELWEGRCDLPCTNPPGEPCCAEIDFCCAQNAEYRRLHFENALIPRPTKQAQEDDCLNGGQAWGYEPAGHACAAGRATTLVGTPGELIGSCVPKTADVQIDCGVKWSSAFRDNIIGASSFLNVRGGLRTNAPSTGTEPCFARGDDGAHVHDHLAGFGNAVLNGWWDIFEGVRAAKGDDFIFLSELGGSTFSKYHRVQGPAAVDYSADLQNVPSGGGGALLNRYFDAPIWKIPMLQMVADELRFADHTGNSSMALPWTMASVTSPAADIDNNGCGNTRRFFHYLPDTLCGEDEAVDFPAVSAALQCWAMAKRVFIHQSSIALDDLNMAAPEAGGTLDQLFGPNPSTTIQYAARGMLEFYRGLALFLESEDYMEYFTGTMERSPAVQILTPGVPETFVVPSSKIAAAFKDLHQFFTLSYAGTGLAEAPNRPDADWRFDRYRPVDARIFDTGNDAIGNFALQTAPEEHESWLPHGMYRSWRDPSRLVLFITNPWGVRHLLDGGETRPMNIFTFDFVNPASSPTINTYSFSFTVNPLDYGFDADDVYTVHRTRFNKNGVAFPVLPMGSGSGTRTFTTTIPGFQFEAFVIDFQ